MNYVYHGSSIPNLEVIKNIKVLIWRNGYMPVIQKQ